jgi:hypothetical protein
MLCKHQELKCQQEAQENALPSHCPDVMDTLHHGIYWVWKKQNVLVHQALVKETLASIAMEMVKPK